MNNRLSIKTIINLSQIIADELGINLPDESYLIKKLKMQHSMPIVVKGNDYSLWIDKYYIAYSHEEENDIHYIYLTQFHIQEERKSYQEAGRERKINISLPKQIEKQFRYAMLKINKHQQKIYVPKKYLDQIEIEQPKKVMAAI